MGWEHIPWYTITDDFDNDFGCDVWHGPTRSSATATACTAPTSSHDRGDEAFVLTWSYLDMTALGRQETWEDSPEGYPQSAALRMVGLARRIRPTRALAVVWRRKVIRAPVSSGDRPLRR